MESADFDVTVDFGAEVTDAIAASDATVSVVGAEGEESFATIEWTIVDYDGTIASDYTATGTVILPEGWVGTPDMITATITVEGESIQEEILEPADEIDLKKLVLFRKRKKN
jgi:hypothetical protein